MRTEPIKCLSSVSKANMGGIKNFPSAVITPITLPVADSTVICLVQLCFGLLPGLIGFVYADCSFAELLSLGFFFHIFSFPWAQLRAQNSPLPPVLASSLGRVLPKGNEFLQSKRCCWCSQLVCESRDDPPIPLLPPSLKKTKNSPKKPSSFSRSWQLGSAGDGGSEADRFCLRERKRDLVSLQMAKAHKDTCALKASLPGKLEGVFHYCLHSSPWKLMGVSTATLHKSCDSSPANWGRGLIMGI